MGFTMCLDTYGRMLVSAAWCSLLAILIARAILIILLDQLGHAPLHARGSASSIASTKPAAGASWAVVAKTRGLQNPIKKPMVYMTGSISFTTAGIISSLSGVAIWTARIQA